MSTLVTGIIIVVGTVVLSVGGFLALLRFWPHLRHKDHNDLLEGVFLVVGTLYGVLLAFVVVTIWDDFSKAKQQTHVEVNALASIVHEAAAFPSPGNMTVRRDVLDYASVVADKEWPLLGKNVLTRPGDEPFDRIWNDLYAERPQTPVQQEFLNSAVQNLTTASAARRNRIEASTATVPVILWILIVIGAVMTIVFLYFFWTDKLWLHGVVIGSLAALIGFVVFLVFALEHPFSGSVSISPDIFHKFVQEWRNSVG